MKSLLIGFCVVSEIEDAKKASENATSLQSPPPANTGTTPDYAAGLTATPSYAPATPAPNAEPAAAAPAASTTAIISSPQQTMPTASNVSPSAATPPIVQTQQRQPTIVTPPQQQIQATPTVVTATPAPVPQQVQQPTHFIQTMRPVPPLLATTSSGQRTLITTDQPQQVNNNFNFENNFRENVS